MISSINFAYDLKIHKIMVDRSSASMVQGKGKGGKGEGGGEKKGKGKVDRSSASKIHGIMVDIQIIQLFIGSITWMLYGTFNIEPANIRYIFPIKWTWPDIRLGTKQSKE